MAAATSSKRLSSAPAPLPSDPPEPDFVPASFRATPRTIPARAPISIVLLFAFFAVCWMCMGGGYLREAARLAQATPDSGFPATILFAARVAPARAGDARSGRVDVRYNDEAGRPQSGFVRVPEASLESLVPGGSMRVWPDHAFLADVPILLSEDGLDTVKTRQRTALVSGFPVFLGGVLSGAAAVVAWRRRRLFARGKLATGEILDVHSDWSTHLTLLPFGIAGETLRAVRYRFRAASGAVESVDRMFRFPGAAGQSLVVIYDERNPSRSLVYALKARDTDDAIML